MDFTTLSGEALTEALGLDFATATNEALTEALDARRNAATTLFALTEPTITEVDTAEALVASIREIEAEQTTRAAAVQDAADRFAAARESFSTATDEADTDEAVEVETQDDATDEADEAEGGDEQDGEDADESDESTDEADADEGNDNGGDAGEGESTVTASASKAQKVQPSAAKKVGARTKRPEVKASNKVVITAAADSGFAAGSTLDDMDKVTQALLNRAKGFAPFSSQTGRAIRSQTGRDEMLNKFAAASFGLDFPASLTASKESDDYSSYQNALKDHQAAMVASMNAALRGDDATLAAAGWCAPSETAYSFIADYVVDGLISVPEVSAPRGGINITTGPAKDTQGAALDDFGFTQTEAQAEAGDVKTCETIVCPPFVDHRLDAIGYCYKIPLLTQKAYPELITDALRLANVMYAHKVNRRVIADLVALSTNVAYSGYGASFTDSLEALSVLATRERRKWNVGENAVMEVKVPVWAREVYRADMSRRTGLALTDVATDQKIAAEFAARRLAVEYVADWQELPSSGALTLPGSFKIMVYPSGTFIKAVEDVINLSAVYDAASLSVNEYTGVFFEQGILTAKAGYGSSILTIPVNTAGETGAAIMTGLGDSTAGGSF